MNLWRRSPIDTNPYRRTAFRVARLPREMMDRSAVVESVAQVRQLQELDPEAHRLDGTVVGASLLNEAELILLDPRKRLLEEFLEHPDETAGNRAGHEGVIRSLCAEGLALLEVPGGSSGTWSNWVTVNAWIREVARSHLSESFGSEISLGAAELELASPWGKSPSGGG